MRRFDDRSRVWASFGVLVLALGFVMAQRLRLHATQAPATTSCQAPLTIRGGTQQSTTTEDAIAWYQDRIRVCPQDQRAYSQLGAGYLQRARETGDPAYYSKADAVIDAALARKANDADALIIKGLLATARHQFAQALDIGQHMLALNPHNAQTYGLIGDAQIELGHYQTATTTIQTMVDLRPDLSSYTRVSYLRELLGDLPGAIAAMQQAIAASSSSAENLAWTHIQLGNLYFQTGRLSQAEHAYQQALAISPDFVHAEAALARIAAARGDIASARQRYADVTARMPVTEYIIAAGELELAAGDDEAAQKQFDLVHVIDQLNQTNGMNTDLEMALFLADHGDPHLAVARAEAAYAQRPGIYGMATLAWALSQDGQHAKAQQMMDQALQYGTQDALLFYHAGMIADRTGDQAAAQQWLEQALALNPFFSPVYATQARQTLAEIRIQ